MQVRVAGLGLLADARRVQSLRGGALGHLADEVGDDRVRGPGDADSAAACGQRQDLLGRGVGLARPRRTLDGQVGAAQLGSRRMAASVEVSPARRSGRPARPAAGGPSRRSSAVAASSAAAGPSRATRAPRSRSRAARTRVSTGPGLDQGSRQRAGVARADREVDRARAHRPPPRPARPGRWPGHARCPRSRACAPAAGTQKRRTSDRLTCPTTAPPVRARRARPARRSARHRSSVRR